MLTQLQQSDVTGTVDITDPDAVADVVCEILTGRFADLNVTVVREAFRDIVEAFWGRYPGLLVCDTPYHDLRHSLGTALLMARMVDGYEAGRDASTPTLGAGKGALAVLLALYHDIGFLRRDSESDINGASLIREHEQRSVDFARTYLARGPLAHFADQARLILATDFNLPLSEALAGVPQEFHVIGKMLGTADLVSQISSRYYLERCRDFLFSEFVIAGANRTVNASGESIVLYATPEELLRKTPGFYEHLAKKRLEGDFEHIYRCIAAHYGGDNPYHRGMQRNLRFLNELITRENFSKLRRKPVALMPRPRK